MIISSTWTELLSSEVFFSPKRTAALGPDSVSGRRDEDKERDVKGREKQEGIEWRKGRKRRGSCAVSFAKIGAYFTQSENWAISEIKYEYPVELYLAIFALLHTAADRARPITDTDSVLCTLEDCAVLQSL